MSYLMLKLISSPTLQPTALDTNGSSWPKSRCGAGTERPPVLEQLVHRVATEFLGHGIGENDGDHGLAHYRRGRNRANVAALDGRRAWSHGGEIDRTQRLHQRGDWLHVR